MARSSPHIQIHCAKFTWSMMRTRRLLTLILAAVAWPAGNVAGQAAARLDAIGIVAREEAERWKSGSVLESSVRLPFPAGIVRVDGSVGHSVGGVSLRRSALAGTLGSPAWGILRLSLAGNYTMDASRAGIVSEHGRLEPALSARRRATGVWVGSTMERGTPPQLQAGLWRVMGKSLISLRGHTRSIAASGAHTGIAYRATQQDTAGSAHQAAPLNTSQRLGRQWTDAEARIDWAGSRIVFTGILGTGRVERTVRDTVMGSQRVLFGRLHTALRVNRMVALILSAGNDPAREPSSVSSARFVTFGIRFAPASMLRETPWWPIRPAAMAFELEPSSSGKYRIVVRVPNARSVELSGDFTAWTPQALRETSPNVWEGAFTLNPGTHRVNLRVDGDSWMAPPGLPSVDDDFNGRVGLLVVR